MMDSLRMAIQCHEHYSGKLGSFLYRDKFKACSPVFSSLAELLTWMQDNGYVLDEHTPGGFVPGRVVKIIGNPNGYSKTRKGDTNE